MNFENIKGKKTVVTIYEPRGIDDSPRAHVKIGQESISYMIQSLTEYPSCCN